MSLSPVLSVQPECYQPQPDNRDLLCHPPDLRQRDGDAWCCQEQATIFTSMARHHLHCHPRCHHLLCRQMG